MCVCLAISVFKKDFYMTGKLWSRRKWTCLVSNIVYKDKCLKNLVNMYSASFTLTPLNKYTMQPIAFRTKFGHGILLCLAHRYINFVMEHKLTASQTQEELQTTTVQEWKSVDRTATRQTINLPKIACRMLHAALHHPKSCEIYFFFKQLEWVGKT